MNLVMQRRGGQAHTVRVRRGVVAQPAVRWHDEANGAVRVIRITRFSDGVGPAVRRAPRGATIGGLDLRGNPGGLIAEAINTVDVFLDHGRILSYSGAHTIGEIVQARHSALKPM